ncbi:MAG: tol-pal system-associated acyl-CoA thioesterase [Burkholderiaceae bacterium]|jgi:acyl-CoA thioester hydrolase|nr:tol-pal system-associated acyl-CoA thioesterase [Burkholderiaceae bacterium]
MSQPKDNTFVFEWPVRVYIEDTDMGGVVFYANYLKFFERARTEWLRSTGITQQTLMEEFSLIFVVSRFAVDYLASARLDDELRLTVEPVHIGRASVDLKQRAFRGEKLLASAELRIVSVSLPAMRPVAIPPYILEKMKSNPVT